MTTGSTGDPTFGALSPTFTGGFGFRKTWSGADGKYETYAGKRRAKWNNYTARIGSRRRFSNQCKVLCADGVVRNYNVLATADNGSSPPWSSQDTLRLQSKLLQKVKGHDFNLAVNLAQMGQVSSMVAFNLGQLGRSILALKRGDFATAARCLGTKPKASRLKPSDVAGRWLELQYGWLPGLSDTFEAVKAFHAISEGPRTFMTRASVSKRIEKNGCASPTQVWMGYLDWHTKTLQYQMYEEMSFGRQLGLTDPLSVAWELIPYSFVVDWFVPIGTYLDNLNAIPKLRGRFLTIETRRQWGMDSENARILSPFVIGASTAKSFVSIPNDYCRITSMERTYSTTLSPPMPRFDLRGAVHGRRIWNAISLAQLRFGRGKGSRRGGYMPAPRKRIPAPPIFRGHHLI